MTKEKKFKGEKMYGLFRKDGSISSIVEPSIEKAIFYLSNDLPIIVEFTVTRVFTRERDIKEIETEI